VLSEPAFGQGHRTPFTERNKRGSAVSSPLQGRHGRGIWHVFCKSDSFRKHTGGLRLSRPAYRARADGERSTGRMALVMRQTIVFRGRAHGYRDTFTPAGSLKVTKQRLR